MGLEFLAMLRTNKDIKVEYENSQELKRLRLSYILHVIDFVCQERQRVFNNDMKALAERDKERVTLDNVFELSQKADGKRRLDAESDVKEENEHDSLEMEEQGESESEDMEESEEDDEALD